MRAPRAPATHLLYIAKARAAHTSHALPLACGAAQSSPPHLSQRGPGRAGREPAVQSTCRRSQNVSARHRAPAKAQERSAIYRESVVLASRANAAARACSCTTLTSVAWVDHMQSSQAHKCSHMRSHASQQGVKSLAPHAAPQPKGGRFAPGTFAHTGSSARGSRPPRRCHRRLSRPSGSSHRAQPQRFLNSACVAGAHEGG